MNQNTTPRPTGRRKQAATRYRALVEQGNNALWPHAADRAFNAADSLDREYGFTAVEKGEIPDPEEEEAADPEEGCTLCVSCGERPWGYGYCGEECEECAHENDRAGRED